MVLLQILIKIPNTELDMQTLVRCDMFQFWTEAV